MNPKQYELPTPESADLEPLAKVLVALRRDEDPFAPSAELRRQVEERLGELETNTQGAVITKEKAMLRNSSGRFRLRDWVFIGGGSIAAAVATTIIFWPPPKSEVAKVTAPRYSDKERWQESAVDAAAIASTPRKYQGVVRAQPETATEELSYERAPTAMISRLAKTAQPHGDMDAAGGIPGMPGGGAGGGMPGMAGGGRGGPSGAGGMPSMQRKKDPDAYNVPGTRAYTPKFEEGSGLPTSDGPNPYPPPGLSIKTSPEKEAAVTSESVPATVNGSGSGIAGRGEKASQRKPAKVPAGMPGMAGGMSGKGAAAGMPGMPGMGAGAGMPGMQRAVGGVVVDGMALPRDGKSIRIEREQLAQLHEGESRQKTQHFSLGLVERDQVGGEQYNAIVENQFLAPTSEPLSTFSIDVDTASYSNIRRFLTAGQLPPPAAVRIEEMVNYFGYSYAMPKGKEPFAVNMETAECPWNPGHVLLRVGLKGKEIARKARPASNLVFLLDVSGSMADENKLPLLKTTMTMLVNELSENDRVTIVTYAGDAGLKLEPTSGDQKEKINQAISSLSAGGSTNGSAGIELAYQKAAEAFIKEGTNRVILATDGDLNVGVTDDGALVKLIKEKAAGGTFLTVLGFGEGNLKDGKLEQIADNGNGMYGYIDSVREGRKMMVKQLSGSLVTIAKDVKIQIEFNPAQILGYRLLGYENRVMAAADFNNDKKDAGEIGAGHTVTALYELVPVELTRKDQPPRPDVEPLKYQKVGPLAQIATPAAAQDPKALTDAATSGELLTLKLRYKEPDGVESRLIEFPLKERGGQFNSASKDFQFAAAVASFGMILRGSQHRGSGNASAVAEIAAGAIGEDPSGLRAEFVDLVRRAERLGIK